MAELAPRRGRMLSPLWADLAEILRGRRAWVWLRMMRISLGWVEVCGCSGRKTEKSVKNRQFLPFLTWVARRHGRLLGPLWADLAEILRGKRARVWLQMI